MCLIKILKHVSALILQRCKALFQYGTNFIIVLFLVLQRQRGLGGQQICFLNFNVFSFKLSLNRENKYLCFKFEIKIFVVALYKALLKKEIIEF